MLEAKPAAMDSFPAPFNGNKALAMLFCPPNPNGEATWQASRAIIDASGVNPGKKLALTVSAGFTTYDVSETIARTMIIFETRVAPQNSEEGYVPVIGAALFDSDGETCRLVWSNPALLQFGSDMAPVSPKFVTTGRALRGVILEGGGTHQGITVTTATVLAEHNNSVVIAARELPTYEDNEGAAEPDGQYKYEAKIEFVPVEEERNYSMKLIFSGTAPCLIEGGDVPFGGIVSSDYTANYYWDEKGSYEEEIECGY